MRQSTEVMLIAVALVFLGCDSPAQIAMASENPTSEGVVSLEGQGVMARGAKPKPQPNPIGCSQDQVAKWDEVGGEWVCANDLMAGTGAGHLKWLLAYGFNDDTESIVSSDGVLSADHTSGSMGPYHWWDVRFDQDMLQCAVVASHQEADPFSGGRGLSLPDYPATGLMIDSSDPALVHFYAWTATGAEETLDNSVLNVTAICP